MSAIYLLSIGKNRDTPSIQVEQLKSETDEIRIETVGCVTITPEQALYLAALLTRIAKNFKPSVIDR